MQTIAELSSYVREAERLLTALERSELVDHLALHPRAGVLLRGTGGIRKLRWGRGGHGTRGGVRVVYYFLDVDTPLYLLTVFAKNEMENLSMAERKELAALAARLTLALRRGC